MLGDWITLESRSSSVDFSQSRLIEIDHDIFDDIIRQFEIKLDFKLSNIKNITFSIQKTIDLHPDNIFQQLPCFEYLHDLRRRLLNSATFDEAAKKVRSLSNADDIEPCKISVEFAKSSGIIV